MHERIIIVPEQKEIKAPLIFLAGPIQGAPVWQREAIDYILENDDKIYVASPRRFTEQKGDFTAEMYAEQVDWETQHLHATRNGGCVLFWLANEDKHFCTRAYAQTSRFELGEWKMMHQYEGANLVVGIDSEFSNQRYIRRRLGQDCPEVPILSTLEETCDAAIALIKR